MTPILYRVEPDVCACGEGMCRTMPGDAFVCAKCDTVDGTLRNAIGEERCEH